MEKKPKNINFDDQISQLPEELVHRILSRLPLGDQVRTSILSKRWEKTWIACGTLQFDFKFFEKNYFCSRASQEEISAKREELMEFAERTLHSCYIQMVSINNLELSPRFYNSKTATFLDRCIGHAIGCNVRKLVIDYFAPEKFIYYNLPQTVLAAKSITELSLGRCSLGSSSCSNITLPSLKILRLYRVCLGDHTIQNLLANFPVIEKFTVRGNCRTSKGTLKHFSLVNPKVVMVEIAFCHFERVEIEATGLQSLSLFFSITREFNISACKNMRTFELRQSYTISEEMINSNLSKLCLLETLKISNCNNWKTIKISSCRRLKELEVIDCEKLVKVEVDDLNLTSFTYEGDNVISFSSNGLALSRADLSLYPIGVNFTWYLKVMEFFGKSVKVLKLHSTSDKNVIFPKEIRELLAPPLCNVEHLILDAYRKLQTQAVEEIVDGFLWFSLHPLTLFISFETYRKNYETLGLKFLYNKEEINNDGNPCCCSSLPIKCWRHSLAEIKIDCAEGIDDEDKKNIRSFLDTKILKNIGGHVTN